MFEAIELGQSLSKPEYKKQEVHFRTELLKLQRELEQSDIATLIIIAGMEGSGKGEVVDNLNKWFDSRGMETHAFWDETDEESARPEYWRFWMRLPARGAISTMFGGWYWRPVYDVVSGDMDETQQDEEAYRIKSFERTLQADGMLIIKLWFHLSPKTYKKRATHRSTAGQHLGDQGRRETKKQYEHFLTAAERLIRHTDTSESPWHLIEADDERFRDASVGQVLIERIKQRLNEQRKADRRIAKPNPVVSLGDEPVTVLDPLDMTQALDKRDYKTQLQHYQVLLGELTWKAYDAGRSSVIVFEGWDAAGKGGAIRRLTSATDARLYRGISITAPTDEENAHHYLWRFWRQIPRAGYVTLYDRSWYGRVLVERVEGFANPLEWSRAYQEINDFEEQLVESGVVVTKFWLHITQEEQLRRFEEREKTPWKQHKLTEEDWRNREKWDDYKEAVNEMVLRTSTAKAPWVLVPADDKFYARIMVMKTVCERLQEALVDGD